MHYRTLLILLLLVAGCELGQEQPGGTGMGSDARSVIDATPRPDGDPSCTVWQHERFARVTNIESLETMPLQVGRSARFRVTVDSCPGDEPGVWDYQFFKNNEVFFDVSLWRPGYENCEEPIPQSRAVWIQFQFPGRWSVRRSDGAPTLELDVGPEPNSCGSESTCTKDCACTNNELCLSGLENGVAIQRCAEPCEFSRDCGGNGYCDTSGDFGGVCVSNAPECALPERPCDSGFSCIDGVCEPVFTLNQFTRHRCDCDSDCDQGLRCVETPDGDWTKKSCEAICHSSSGGWCQGAHECSAIDASFGTGGICEWLGE